MNTAGELFENAILHWRDAKGKGTALIPAPLNDKIMVLGVLQRMFAKSSTCKVIIATNNFQERIDIIEFITHQEDEDNNEEFKKLIKDGNIKVLTIDYLLKNSSQIYPNLVIVYHPLEITKSLEDYIVNTKFKLIVLTKLLSSEDMIILYKIAALLDDFKQNEVEAIRLSTPVEESRISIDIPEDSNAYEILRRYNEYITTTLNIFGSFDIMQQARVGNQQLNISASQICAQIAAENGWNEHLDMNMEFNRQIDRLYNPINIRERASQTYEFIRKRSQFLSDYEDKLDAILNIVNNNKDKKILIINKRGEFANKVTDYINNLSESIICGNYHDNVDNIPAVDKNGNPLYYKTGAHKGERRMMGAKAQRSFNEAAFNRGDIRILSTNNAPDKELCIDVDVIIITSPQCEDIKSYMYRLSNVGFRAGIIHLYSIYCKNTMEEKLLEDNARVDNHTIINDCEKSVINENDSDFVIVD